jgi:hypothetical protein
MEDLITGNVGATLRLHIGRYSGAGKLNAFTASCNGVMFRLI